jgi:cytochrome c biogenesis protein CcdA
MDDGWVAATSALWLGFLASISPCPLATNIAAVSFIAKQVGSTRRMIASGLAYAVGRMLTYLALGALLVGGVLSIPGASRFLQEYVNKLLGPVLIVVGVVLLELVQLRLGAGVSADRLKERVRGGSLLAAGSLGIVFALAFCPFSAALFFGSLIPLAVSHDSSLLLPSLFGLGTGLPVLVFGILIATGAHLVGKAFDKLSKVEWWARRVTGSVFVLVGIYFSLVYVFEVGA